MTYPNTVNILRQTRNMLVDGGWIQGDFHKRRMVGPTPGRDAYCLLGAMNKVSWDTPGVNLYPDTEQAKDEFARTVGVARDFLITWNDKTGRTEAEVIDAIDRTIARLEATP